VSQNTTRAEIFGLNDHPNFIYYQVIEKETKKTVHNEHKNTIDMLDYEAVTYICVA